MKGFAALKVAAKKGAASREWRRRSRMLLRNWTLTLREAGEGGVPTNIIRLRDPIMATALCSAQEAEKEGWGRERQEGRRMKGKGRKERYPIATNIGEIAQIACFAQHET